MKIFPDIDFSLPGKTVRLTDNGRVTEDDWGTYALIGGVLPASLSASPGRQAEEAFRALEAALGELGMDFSHVVRTWIYADRILTWYGELNRARDAFFREKGVYDRFVPASTGIGWTGGSGARIVLGAYAVKAKRPGALTVAALPSPLQCPALAYGSSFSRAAEVGTPAWTQVVVSGTAAIHPGSHDVAHVGDVEAQIGCTMKAVEAIYASRGFSLSDVTSALVYLKRPAYRENWEAWLAAHPGFPRARAKILVADVCRDEWLFEIESEALKWK